MKQNARISKQLVNSAPRTKRRRSEVAVAALVATGFLVAGPAVAAFAAGSSSGSPGSAGSAPACPTSEGSPSSTGSASPGGPGYSSASPLPVANPPEPGSPVGASGTDAPSPLGGYQLAATGAGMSVYYEQPNFPVPATPTLEADVGYSTAAYSSGPAGEAVGSTLYPGQVVAGFGGQLATLFPGVPVPPAPNWPIQSAAIYPQGPDTSTNDSTPGVTMDASADQASSQASASLGTTGGQPASNGSPPTPFAIPVGYMTAQWLASASQSTVNGQGQAVSQATSAAQGVTIAGGIISIGNVLSQAVATSDGSQAVLAGSTCVANVDIGGQQVTVDSSGVHPAGSASGPPTPSEPGLSTLLGGVQPLLKDFGISMSVTAPTDKIQGAQGSRHLDGLVITVDLSSFDAQVQKLAALLPSQLVDNLPLPPPDKQLVTIDIGWVTVSSGASLAYSAGDLAELGGGPGSGDMGALGASSDLGGLGSTDLGGLGSTDLGTGTGSGGAIGSTEPLASGPGSISRHPRGFTTAATGSALFKGVGAGLLVLGVALAAALARGFLKIDSALSGASAISGCEEVPGDGE